MRKSNKITIFNGAITIDKTKLDEIISFISYIALSVAQYALLAATILFCILILASGGDGHLYHGNPMLIFENLASAVLCGVGSKLSSAFKTIIINSAKIRNEKRHKSKQCNPDKHAA